MSVSKEGWDRASFGLTFQSNDLEFTAMFLFSSQCAAALMKMSDKLELLLMHGKKRCFLFQAPYHFRVFFFIFFWGFWSGITPLLIWRIGGEKNLQDFSIIYHTRHLRPGFKVSFWISTVTHACQDADMTSWEESSGKAKGCVELMFGTSDAVTQTTVSKIEAAEPTSWWEGLLGNSYNHCTLQFHPWPYYLPNKRNPCLYLKYYTFIPFRLTGYLLDAYIMQTMWIKFQ